MNLKGGEKMTNYLKTSEPKKLYSPGLLFALHIQTWS